MNIAETDLFADVPSTRYQGSKRRMLPWIWSNLKGLEFETVLDAFGGTGSVSYMLKLMGKTVTFNDCLLANYQTGIALIENASVTLHEDDVAFLLRDNSDQNEDFITRTFNGIYYLDAENTWLDNVAQNIRRLSRLYRGRKLRIKRALAYHALFQACLRKRPFNLFHRKNLYLRTAKVDRRFGNKTTWDQPFERLFRAFATEATSKVFGNGRRNRAICYDVFDLDQVNSDLVYMDPPYMRPGESKPKDYHALYHFLEGLVDYDNWSERIDWATKHRRRELPPNGWMMQDPEKNFHDLFQKFRNSIIVVSWGEPGVPSIQEIVSLLENYKSRVVVRRKSYNYRLNRNNGEGMYEVLIIGQ